MSFWDRLFQSLFGRKSTPAPKPAPKQTAPTPAPAPRAGPPAPAPTPTPPPAAPAPAPTPAPAPAVPSFTLDALVAQDPNKIPGEQIDTAAQALGVEASALRAVLQVESAGFGFSADNRPLILFEPTVFSRLTGGRYDQSNPAVSAPAGQRVAIGRTQRERWALLTEAFALDSIAALQATSWGMFQVSGLNASSSGYPNVFEMVQDLARSEARQMAAFQRYLENQGLVDELQRRDWEGFARVYEGEENAVRYGGLLAQAYTQIMADRSTKAPFLAGLKAQSMARLSVQDFAAAAQRLGVETAAVRAVAKVETGSVAGFATDGRPTILFEPHIFSRLTRSQFDATHPHLSYPGWGERPYPQTQAERWNQLAEAYALNPEAAVGSCSWGAFQIMGFNFPACGFPSATALVTELAISEERQLRAWENFIRSQGLIDEMQRLDWEGFARVYNGPGQVERYGRLLRQAYEGFKAQA